MTDLAGALKTTSICSFLSKEKFLNQLFSPRQCSNKQISLHFSKVEQNLGKAPVKARNVQNTKHSSVSLQHRIIYKAVAKHYTGRISWAMESKLSQCDSKSSNSSYYTAYLKMLLPLQQYSENILVLRNNRIRQ